MALRWNDFKRFLASPFRQRQIPVEVTPQPGLKAEERRLDHLRRQIVAIEVELLALRSAVAANRDLDDATTALVIRRGLVRARDLRYKAGLLEAEIRRMAPDRAAPQDADRPPRAAGVPRRVRQAAKHALATAEIAKRSQRTSFERAIGDLLGPSPKLRQRAISTLRRLRSPAAVPLLKAVLSFEDDSLRIKALKALSELGIHCAVAEVEHLLRSPNHRLRLAALQTLARAAAKDAIPACLGCLADRNSEIRRTAISILGWLGARQAEPALSALLRDEAPKVRAAAAETLGSLGSDQAVYVLIRALADEQASVRIAAKTALDRLLASRIAIDVDQRAAELMPAVEALARWWVEARVNGAPWQVPATLERTTVRDQFANHEVVPLFTQRGASDDRGAAFRRQTKPGVTG
jgi:hypothetical protein